MARSISLGYIDSSSSGGGDGSGGGGVSITLPMLNYGTDFAVQSALPDRVDLVNLTSPLDQMETIRYQYRNIADIYKGTSIDPSVYAPSRAGRSVAAVLLDTVKVTDSSDAAFRLDFPVKVSISLTAPLSVEIDDATLNILFERAIALWFDSNGNNKLGTLIRGSLKPAEM